ncbi:hypothetical protein JHK85_054455 [Glycine max]|nr:hypothetical protein JHK85_054455 [Glycine max]
MADATKYVPIGGGNVATDLKSLSFILKTKKTVAAAYAFILAFVAFTVFLAFSPSPNASSPWFTNIFSPASTTDGSYKPQIPNIFSLLFPNSSDPLHNNTNSSRSPYPNTTTESQTLKETSLENRTQTTLVNSTQDAVPVPTTNQTTDSHAPSLEVKFPPPLASKEPPGVVKNQTFNSGEAKPMSTNQTTNATATATNVSVSFPVQNVPNQNTSSNSSVKVDSDYHFSVELFVSPFLVQEGEMTDKNGTKKETLRLDLVGKSSSQYKDADILVFNTGHWWTHDKTSKGQDYYQEGSHVYAELNVLEAFRRALTTWSKWVDANINPSKTMVFFRGYSASHFSGGQWNSGGQCDSETDPIDNEKYLTEYPDKMKVLEKVLKNMKTHVTYQNITRMTDFRKDGHPSIYRKQNLSPEERKSPLRFQDCSHWCLPGVPDLWNEVLYAELLLREYQNQHEQKHR